MSDVLWGVFPRAWLSGKSGYVDIEVVVNHLIEEPGVLMFLTK